MSTCRSKAKLIREAKRTLAAQLDVNPWDRKEDEYDYGSGSFTDPDMETDKVLAESRGDTFEEDYKGFDEVFKNDKGLMHGWNDYGVPTVPMTKKCVF